LLDTEVDYAPRIVVLEDKLDRNSAICRKKYSHRIYGSDLSEDEKQNDETLVFSGTNRKGFFTKEKRKKGKKGVLKSQARSHRSRSNIFNNKSDGESDSDSAIDNEPEKDTRVIMVTVKPKTPEYIRHAKLAGCGCSLCTGRSKNEKVAKKRDIQRNLDVL